MNERRTLIVHAGGGKAGSSAIQSALGRAVDCLAEVGISYAHAPTTSSPYEITSGNGIHLYDHVVQSELTSKTADLVESFIGDHATGICSSEYLGSMAKSLWKRVLHVAADRNIDVKVVYLVRSPIGYVAASYNQDVKRGGETRSIDEYARDASWQHLDDLEKLTSFLDDTRLRVINYDIVRGDIIGAFLNAWPELEPAKPCLQNLESITVNRSLSPAELEVMRRVNARIDGSLGPQISDRIIFDQPELKTRLHVPDAVAGVLRRKFTKPTTWINSRFFAEAAAPLRVSAGVSVGQVVHDETTERALAVVLDWALGRLAESHADITSIRKRLLEIDWHNATNDAVPADFDPVAYIFINEDLLRSQTPPYEHYIFNGSAEHRQYRWPVRLDPSQDESMASAIARLKLDDPTDWAATPVWTRIRHALQLEGLLHAFAHRERQYLEQIRRDREEQGYDSAQLDERMDQVVKPITQRLASTHAESVEQIAELSARLSQLEAQQLDGIKTLLETLSHRVTAETSALRADHAALTELITRKDEELASQRQLIDRYRESGIFQRFKWLFRASARP